MIWRLARIAAVTLLVAGWTAEAAIMARGDETGATQGSPARHPWSRYNAILWQPFASANCAALKSLGITAGALIPSARDNPAATLPSQTAPFLSCGLGWYVENIATDFYSAYHRWSPDWPVNWRFAEVKQIYHDNPLDARAFRREPSLSDPSWLKRIRARLQRTVRAYRPDHPLYYNLADEPGIADLSVQWDFDFSPPSLEAMRQWLRQRYPSLAALNRQWSTAFAGWDRVIPMTTAQAIARADGNISSWSDFKAWMDEAFARALKAGSDAVHEADPTARAGFEGGQIPGWGGYDYARLAHAVDVMELYDGGGNLEIVRALNPKAILLTTSAASGAAERRDLWRELLRGTRGVILWDPQRQIIATDGTVGARGRALAATLHEIQSGIGALLATSQRVTAPVALLYSPESMRVAWFQDWRGKGTAWSDRDANSDYEDGNVVRRSMVGFFALLQHSGLEPQVLTARAIEEGALRRRGLRVLILPRVLALSRIAARAIEDFVADGGVVIADGKPGLDDAHGRPWPHPMLASLFAKHDATGQSFRFGKGRVLSFVPGEKISADHLVRFQRILVSAAAMPDFLLRRSAAPTIWPSDIEAYEWRKGRLTVLALQRDPGAAEADDTERVTFEMRRRAFFYDLRRRQALGHSDRVAVAVGTVTPTILAISDRACAAAEDTTPGSAGAGGEISRFCDK